MSCTACLCVRPCVEFPLTDITSSYAFKFAPSAAPPGKTVFMKIPIFLLTSHPPTIVKPSFWFGLFSRTMVLVSGDQLVTRFEGVAPFVFLRTKNFFIPVSCSSDLVLSTNNEVESVVKSSGKI